MRIGNSVSAKVGSGWSIPNVPGGPSSARAESLIEEIRHASRRSTEQGVAGDCPGDAEEAVVYRIRFIEPISADFAVLVGDAIRDLRSSLDQVAYQLAVRTLVRSPRMQSE